MKYADEAAGLWTENMTVGEGVGTQNSSDASATCVMEGDDGDGVEKNSGDTDLVVG